MTDQHGGRTTHSGELTPDRVARLIQSAGPRPALPRPAFEQLYRETKVAWSEKTHEIRAARRRERTRHQLLVAAVVVMSLGLGWMLLWPDSTQHEAEWPGGASNAARILAVYGADPSSALAPGGSVAAGEVIDTGPSQRVVLALSQGAIVRLDHGSKLKILSPQDLELIAGALYVDAGPAAEPLAVRTALGVARDIGTRFEVRLMAQGLRVLVRDGAVAVDHDDQSHQADAGQSLMIDRAGTVTRAAIEPDDPAWAWLLDAASPFELEGATVEQLLDWVSRETGWRIQYQDTALEQVVRATIAHGSIAGIRPDEAPAIVLPGSRLTFAVQDGVLRVMRID
jgi:ferric-dicitrate binding protein FerR (iron transport regulator)